MRGQRRPRGSGRRAVHAVVSFVRGEGADAVGMRITMEGELPPLQELAARLVTQSLEPDGVLQLHQLETADIPVWRSEQLDEEAAYADEPLWVLSPHGGRPSL